MTTETIDKLYLELSQVTTALTKRECDLAMRVYELEDLLTSARCIAQRKGEDVAWERFDDRLKNMGIGYVTARTFRILPGEVPQTPVTQI